MSQESVTSLEEATRLGRSLPLAAADGARRTPRAGQVHRVNRRRLSPRREHTGGQVAIVEHPFPPGALVPPHVQTREDEFSIVTAGSIGFRSGPDDVELGPGGYIVKPRGEVHTMWDAGAGEAPAGFERFFAELADLVDAGTPDPSDFEALGETPRLIRRPHVGSGADGEVPPQLPFG